MSETNEIRITGHRRVKFSELKPGNAILLPGMPSQGLTHVTVWGGPAEENNPLSDTGLWIVDLEENPAGFFGFPDDDVWIRAE